MVGDHLMLSYLPGSLLHPVELSSAKGSHSSFWHFSDKWMFLLWDLEVTFICRLEETSVTNMKSLSLPKSTPQLPHQHLTDAFNRTGAEVPNICTLETKLSADKPLRDALKPNLKTCTWPGRDLPPVGYLSNAHGQAHRC